MLVFFVKYYPQKFIFVYNWDLWTVKFQAGVIMYFFLWQKWTHFVFVLENLNPFTIANLLIFFSPCCSFCSIVWIYFDLKHIMRSSMYRDPSNPNGNSLITLFIFMSQRVTDNILPCGVVFFRWYQKWVGRIEPLEKKLFITELAIINESDRTNKLMGGNYTNVA